MMSSNKKDIYYKLMEDQFYNFKLGRDEFPKNELRDKDDIIKITHKKTNSEIMKRRSDPQFDFNQSPLAQNNNKYNQKYAYDCVTDTNTVYVHSSGEEF